MYQPAMGNRIVSFATANGKAWLATLDEATALRIATADGLGGKSDRADIGPKALRSAAAFKRDLADVRKRGYALADEEAEPGVAALAVAVRCPATGRTLGTTSIAGPVVRLSAPRHAELLTLLRDAAAEFARVWPGNTLKTAAD